MLLYTLHTLLLKNCPWCPPPSVYTATSLMLRAVRPRHRSAKRTHVYICSRWNSSSSVVALYEMGSVVFSRNLSLNVPLLARQLSVWISFTGSGQ